MDEQKSQLIGEAMGAANVFCSAVGELLDQIVDGASDGTLTLQQIRLMMLISRPEHRFKVMDIAEFLGVTNAAASRAIDRLVQRGLIDRSISADDRRAVDLALTADGHTMLERFASERNERLLEMLRGFSDEKLRALITLLDEISPVLLRTGGGSADRCARCGLDVRASCVLRDIMGHRCAGEEAKAIGDRR